MRELAGAEEVKIKTQVRDKMDETIKRIEEETTISAADLGRKQALLKERDFMI